jgi:hypothetical protein
VRGKTGLRRIKQAHERNGTMHKARSSLTASGIRIPKLARCVFLVNMWGKNQTLSAEVGGTTGTGREARSEHISRLVRTKMASFEQERIEDFKESLAQLLDGMITKLI